MTDGYWLFCWMLFVAACGVLAIAIFRQIIKK